MYESGHVAEFNHLLRQYKLYSIIQISAVNLNYCVFNTVCKNMQESSIQYQHLSTRPPCAWIT